MELPIKKGTNMLPKHDVKLSPAVKRMSPEVRFEKLKEICKKNNVRYFADKAKRHYKLKPLMTTEKVCETLAKYCDYYINYGEPLSLGYPPQDRKGRTIYSYETGNGSNADWVVVNFYVRKTVNSGKN
jgi:SAM-dependent MidA family methyltransferase